MVVEVDPEGVVRIGEEVQEVAALQWDGVEVDLEEVQVKENVVIDLEVPAGVHLDPEMNIFLKREGVELKIFLLIMTHKKMTVVSTVKTTNKAILR